MLDQKLLKELEEYIKIHESLSETGVHSFELKEEIPILQESLSTSELEDFIKKHRQPTLQEVLFGFIDQTENTDAEIYKKAGLDRKHFSKIRSNPNYRPKKNTIIALALALELDLEDTEELLHAAGYSLSESDTTDLIIQFFLEKQMYDIHAINQALHYFSLKPLSGT
ncbi:hypothetical protein GCM10008967_30910 [Bacillus carboniphilus]|uniref:XRE family transcriptional regulator n=1 Tax=Bacillus carboniphilus TaxID=86663 RepID=A0ABP3G7E1_9BACI